MLSLLLSQFRQRYPQGSLTSDLLTIHDGLYVVRVCAGVNGISLASGLGANTSLEAAEDIATTRALERLSISVAPPTSLPSPGLQPDNLDASVLDANPPAAPAPQPQLALLKSNAAPIAEPQADVLAPESQPLLSVLNQPEPTDLPLPLAQPEPIDLPLPLAQPELVDMSPPLVEPEPADALKAPALDLPPSALASPPLPKAVSLPPDSQAQGLLVDNFDEHEEFVDLGSGPAVSVDLSDIIAQTDVELQRLGWGVNQGRKFLEQTYGKRSRHDLTDEELLEFLLYLETQPTPGSP